MSKEKQTYPTGKSKEPSKKTYKVKEVKKKGCTTATGDQMMKKKECLCAPRLAARITSPKPVL